MTAMLRDEIKRRSLAAMKAGHGLEKEILRVALGEIQTQEARTSETMSDEQAAAIVRKLIKSNAETLASSTDDEQRATLRQEIEILESLLPKALTVDEIVATLSPVADAITGATADGPATGIAMKHLKASSAVVDGKDVAAAVKRMRG